jgi:hypothetical protein
MSSRISGHATQNASELAQFKTLHALWESSHQAPLSLGQIVVVPVFC